MARKEVRNLRLRDCVEVMRRLYSGDEVNHEGLVTVDRARLFTLPEVAPPLIGAALTVATAAWVAQWADGLITINQSHEQLRRMIDAYRSAGGRGAVHLQVHLSYAADDETARAIAHDQWRTNVLPSPTSWDLNTAADYDAVGELVSPERVEESVRVSADPARHAGWLQEYVELGIDEIYLHHVGQQQEDFIDVFGAKVLPQLGVTRKAG